MRVGILLVVLLAIGATGWYFWNASPSSDPGNPPSPVVADHSVEEAAWVELRDKLERGIERGARKPDEPESSATESASRERLKKLSEASTEAEFLEAAGITPEDEAEYAQWARQRGFVDERATGYQYYDRATLEAMADSGDMYAQQQLGFEAIRNNEFLRAEVLLRRAATRGSVYAMDLLAFNATSRALEAGNAEEPEQAKQRLMEAWAWSELSNRRGFDKMLWAGTRETNIEHNMDQLGVELSEEDRAHISAMADEWYDSLEQERDTLNLEPFDNSVPALLTKFQRALELRRKTQVESE